jgi:hypothetical protein
VDLIFNLHGPQDISQEKMYVQLLDYNFQTIINQQFKTYVRFKKVSST